MILRFNIKFITILGIFLLFSCSSVLRINKVPKYKLTYLRPIPEDYINGEYYYKSAPDYKPVLMFNDSAALLYVNLQTIIRSHGGYLYDTLLPYYSYYCNELGTPYGCGYRSDCWKCKDSSRQISIFKGKISEVFFYKKGSLTCSFFDTTIQSKITIELVR